MNIQSIRKQEKIDKVLVFCKGGKTSEEIRDYMNIPKSSINNFLADLQLHKQLYKVIPEVVHFKGMGQVPFYFVTTGTECNRPPPVILPKDTHSPTINWDFVHVMHRILFVGQSCSKS